MEAKYYFFKTERLSNEVQQNHKKKKIETFFLGLVHF